MFDGVIPSELSRLFQLNSLNLGGNRFNGSIPVQLGNCSQLSSLNLSRNGLEGVIPVELSLLEDLTVLDASQGNKNAAELKPVSLSLLLRHFTLHPSVYYKMIA